MLDTVLTLGPQSSDEGVIKALLNVADRFRLNTSHMDAAALAGWLSKLERIFHNTGRTIAVVIDLQGAKMRIGYYPPVDFLPEKVSLVYKDISDCTDHIPVPHRQFFTQVKSGDVISLNDARIHLKILKTESNSAEALVLNNGALTSHKGINRAVHPIPFEGLTQKDRQMIDISKKCAFVQYAFSFVCDGSESDKIKPLIGDRRLIAKIERPEALENVTAIDSKFDEMWFCRGDLGAQCGVMELGRLQADFAARISDFSHPCLLAGQVLEHMTHFPKPTRSEIVHLYDIEKNGFAGIVLSDETAIGKNPLAVATFLKDFRINKRG